MAENDVTDGSSTSGDYASISRVLLSLRILGLENEARALFEALTTNDGRPVSESARRQWLTVMERDIAALATGATAHGGAAGIGDLTGAGSPGGRVQDLSKDQKHLLTTILRDGEGRFGEKSGALTRSGKRGRDEADQAEAESSGKRRKIGEGMNLIGAVIRWLFTRLGFVPSICLLLARSACIFG